MKPPGNRPSGVTKLDQNNPWPGLEGFVEENKELFKGRRRETLSFFRLIKAEQLCVLYGKSGFGKSSLLRAGVFPELRRANFVPVYIGLKHDEREPPLSQQVKDEISREIEAGGFDAPKPTATETLWEYFYRKDVEWWDKQNDLVTPVLVFDQFEEVITVGRENPVRQSRADAFLSELENLAEHSTPEAVRARFEDDPKLAEQYDSYRNEFKIVISLREDFLPELEGLRGRLKGVMTNRYRLLPMNGEQALEVVLKPAPDLVEDAVAVEIVDRVSRSRNEPATAGSVGRDELAQRFVEPALLSMLCSELNRKRRSLGLPKITSNLVSQAQVEAVLHEFYDRGMAAVSEQLHTFVEERLITESGARNRCAHEDALLREGVSSADISRLIDAHILRLDISSDVSWLELTHDRLAEIAKASRDVRRERRQSERTLAEARERESEALRKLAQSRQRTRRILVGSIAALAIVLASAVSYTHVRAEQIKSRLKLENERKQSEQERETQRRRVDELSRQAQQTRRILDRLTAQIGVAGGAAEPDEGSDVSNPGGTQGSTNVAVPVSDISRALLSALDEPGTAQIVRETTLARAAQGLLSFRAGAEEQAKPLLEKASAELAKLREKAPGDRDVSMREIEVRLALGDLIREKLGPRSTDASSIESVEKQYNDAKGIVDGFLASAPTDTAWQTREAECLDHLGDLSKVQGRVKEARSRYDQAHSIRETILGSAPEKPADIQLAVARGWNKVGNSYFLESPKSALESYTKALNALPPPTSSNFAVDQAEELRGIIYGNIGAIQAKMKNWPEVQHAFHEQVDVFGNLYRSNPGNLRWRKSFALACDAEAGYYIVDVPESLRHRELALPLAMKAVILTDERNRFCLITLRAALHSFSDRYRKELEEALTRQIEAMKTQPQG
jgi:tetratricopeptide (TPR) repeat protein